MKRIAILSTVALAAVATVSAASAQTRQAPKQQPTFQPYNPTFGQSNKGIAAGAKTPGLANGVTFAQPKVGGNLVGNAGGALVGNAGGALVGNAGGALVGNAGGTFRPKF